MKIYLLPVNPKLQPESQKIEYPSGNIDYGVEQDFLKYIADSSLVADSPDSADWHYLPVFWTRWHLNHDYAKQGVKELQAEVSKILSKPNRTFTICQYDDGPVVNLGSTTIFLASRKSKTGYDIPLLRNDLRTPRLKPRKRYLASFIGRTDTHPVRKKMAAILKDDERLMISDGDKGQKFFVDETLRSYIALCPRGYGGSSFRFYEAMQLGVVPLLVGDIDTRPFKDIINWEEISLYARSPEAVPGLLKNLDQKQLADMGKRARGVYRKHLQYGKWPRHVIQELGQIK